MPPTFDSPPQTGAAARVLLALGGLVLDLGLVTGVRVGARDAQRAHAVHRAVEEGLRCVDGADGPRERCSGAAVGLVHPPDATLPQVVQLALGRTAQVALGPVVQVLHAGRCVFSQG